jgi:prepilin-type processing-associated H-X9-DG protein
MARGPAWNAMKTFVTNVYRSEMGITRLEVAITIGLLLILAACVVTPKLQKQRAISRSLCCNCNIKQFQAAFRIWASDNRDLLPMQISTNQGGTAEFITAETAFRHFQIISNELGSTPILLVCPEDRNRHVPPDFVQMTSSNVSYFASLNATLTNPYAFLMGDRNVSDTRQIRRGLLTLGTKQTIRWTSDIHNGFGNLALCDGSVAQVTSQGLLNYWQNTHVETNRLLFP